MQLTMESKKFDKKAVRQMLLTEDEFISRIFAITSFPKREEEEQNDSSQEEKSTIQVEPFTSQSRKSNQAQTLEELHAKLQELKGSKKLDYKQKLLKKHLKNKLKKKKNIEKRFLQKKLARTEQNAARGNKVKIDNEEVAKVPKPKPVFNSEGKMVFSKFDFSEIGVKKKIPKTDPKKTLQQLHQKKEKLKQLEESGDKETADNIKEKNAWKSALARANGEKIRDDPELLKRTIKQKERKKKQSAKKWNSRIENVQKSMQERQEKRRDNIMKKKKEKTLNKLKTAAKKGRVISGL